MTLDEIKKFFEENKDNEQVKAYLGEFKTIAPEAEKAIVESFKNSEIYKLELQKEGDRRVTSAINKFKEETLPKQLEEEISKRFPKETEEQKRIRVLESSIEQLTNKEKRANIKEKLIKTLSSKKLDIDLIDFISVENDDEIDEKISKLETIFTKSVVNSVNERLKGSATDPKKGSDKSSVGKIAKEDLKKLSPIEYEKAKKEGRIDYAAYGMADLSKEN